MEARKEADNKIKSGEFNVKQAGEYIAPFQEALTKEECNEYLSIQAERFMKGLGKLLRGEI